MRFGLIILLLISCISCEKSATITESRNKTLIISSFPKTGQTLSNLSIRKFNDNGLLTVPVNDAEVNVVWKNNNFGLTPSSNQDGLYSINNSNFTFLPNNDYRLEVFYNGELTTGETTMPANFDDFDISESIIDIFDDDGNLINPIQSEWRLSNNLVYSVSISPSNTNSENLIDFSSLDANEVQAYRNQLSSTFKGNSFNIHPSMFTHYGDNTIQFIAVDSQYADFFELNENGTTFSNIKNGKGYFIGIAQYSIVVKVE